MTSSMGSVDQSAGWGAGGEWCGEWCWCCDDTGDETCRNGDGVGCQVSERGVGAALSALLGVVSRFSDVNQSMEIMVLKQGGRAGKLGTASGVMTRVHKVRLEAEGCCNKSVRSTAQYCLISSDSRLNQRNPGSTISSKDSPCYCPV